MFLLSYVTVFLFGRLSQYTHHFSLFGGINTRYRPGVCISIGIHTMSVCMFVCVHVFLCACLSVCQFFGTHAWVLLRYSDWCCLYVSIQAMYLCLFVCSVPPCVSVSLSVWMGRGKYFFKNSRPTKQTKKIKQKTKKIKQKTIKKRKKKTRKNTNITVTKIK